MTKASLRHQAITGVRGIVAGGQLVYDQPMSETGDKSILAHIDDLIAEEKQLRATHLGHGLTGTDRERLQHIEVELDQAWDLLRQRRALEESGADREGAHERPSSEV